MKQIKPVRILFGIMILSMVLFTAITYDVKAEKDCLDYSIESGEPVILIGVETYFRGPVDLDVNHYMNYEIIDENTIQFNDYMYNKTWIMSTRSWEEIRPGVYTDGFNFFKLFIYRDPQRYWRKMI